MSKRIEYPHHTLRGCAREMIRRGFYVGPFTLRSAPKRFTCSCRNQWKRTTKGYACTKMAKGNKRGPGGKV